jgi:hypothetical protein
MTTPAFDVSVFHGRDAWSRDSVTSPEASLQAQMGKVFSYLKGLHATHLIYTGVRATVMTSSPPPL